VRRTNPIQFLWTIAERVYAGGQPALPGEVYAKVTVSVAGN